VTVDEAAHALRVTRGTMYRRIQTGQVRAVRLGDGPKAPLRVEASELDRYTATHTIGNDIAAQAEQLLARRGEDPDDPNLYAEALSELGYAAAIFADKVERAVHADMQEHHAGYRVTGSAHMGSDVVDVEAVVTEELARLGNPLPVGVALLGPKGLGREALRILKDKGVSEYDAAGYRKAIRQAIKNALNPKREIR